MFNEQKWTILPLYSGLENATYNAFLLKAGSLDDAVQ